MAAASVTGTGPGSAETPIRPLQQLTKVLGVDGLAQFYVNEELQTQNVKDFSNFTMLEQDSGKRYYDGRVIYTKTLQADAFDSDSGYAYVPHGIVESFDLVSSNGYVSGAYSTFANYKDDTYFYWFWTGSVVGFTVVITLYYVKNI